MRDSDVIVRAVSPAAVGDWDGQVAKLAGATIFHGAAWAAVLETTYGFSPLYLWAERRGKLCGLLPLMEVRSWITGCRGACLPFTDRCEPLFGDADVLDRLFGTAVACARARGWKRLDIHGGAASLKARPALCYHGHRLDLTRGVDALWNRCTSAVRRAVQKADRSDVRVEFRHDLAAVTAFHELMCRTRKRHGLPPQPLAFFHALHREIIAKQQGYIVLAQHRGRPVAGALFLEYRRTALFKFGASDETKQDLRANNSVMWHAIARAASAGITTLDFGRTSLEHEGLRRFKLGWGTEEFPVKYLRFDCRTGEFAQESDRVHGWHNQVFKHLPGTLSRAIGALAYRHVA